MRRTARLGLLAASLACAPAHAEPSADARSACAPAYEQGQRHQQRGEFVAARHQYEVCAQACPPALARDCAHWLTDVADGLPSIVVSMREANGTDVQDARVLVDGRVLSDCLDGRALEVDPGEHVLRVERAGAEPHERRLLLREGERRRAVVFDLQLTALPRRDAARPAPAVLSRERGLPTGSWILGGVAAAALGTFAGFAISGRAAQVKDLDPCRPDCDARAIDGVRTRYLVADISLVISAAALAGAVGILLLRPSVHTPR